MNQKTQKIIDEFKSHQSELLSLFIKTLTEKEEPKNIIDYKNSLPSKIPAFTHLKR